MPQKCPLISLALLLMPQALYAADHERPNIVFIMSDDHANKAISAYGGLIETPHLDRLAAEGMLFNNAFCTNSICGPSRAVILTGKYSHLNGFLVNETTRFDGMQTTFPKLFQKAGYETAVIGKWHLGTEPTGFDYWDVLPGQGEYYDPEFINMGEVIENEGYATEIIAEKSVKWLRNRDSEKPFVLLSQHKAPHSDFNPSPKYMRHFDNHTFPEPENLFDDYEGRSEGASVSDMRIDPHLILQYQWDEKLHIPEHLAGKERTRWLYQWYMRRYLACVLSVDDAVGSILDALDELGLAENTIVVYTSDQGFFLGEHGWYDKRYMYEESLRMPFIVRYPPSIEPGSIEDRIVLNLDFAQTFLDYAGIPAPEDMQGRSLRPLLDGDPVALWRRSMYYHFYEYPGWHYVKRHYGVRTDRFKLIRYYHDIEAWEMYDLETDPSEMANLAYDPAYANVRAELEAELARLQAHYGDSPELAQEMVERYPHGSYPEWGRYSDLEPHGDLDGWRAAQQRSSPSD